MVVKTKILKAISDEFGLAEIDENTKIRMKDHDTHGRVIDISSPTGGNDFYVTIEEYDFLSQDIITIESYNEFITGEKVDDLYGGHTRILFNIIEKLENASDELRLLMELQ
jgi:hypothetical protein